MRGEGGGLPISTRNTKSVKRRALRSRQGGAAKRALVFLNKIASLRRACEPALTQRELSVRLGISSRHLRRIERGEIRPKAALLAQIAKALLVTVADLYFRRRDGRG